MSWLEFFGTISILLVLLAVGLGLWMDLGCEGGLLVRPASFLVVRRYRSGLAPTCKNSDKKKRGVCIDVI